MIQETSGKQSYVLFQEWKDDNPPEPAILIEGYGDAIQLTQNENTINLNYHHVNELVKLLKQLKP